MATNASRTMLVDLADVSFIDFEGRALLARMRQGSQTVVNGSFDKCDRRRN